jgi:hypothetical protein
MWCIKGFDATQVKRNRPPKTQRDHRRIRVERLTYCPQQSIRAARDVSQSHLQRRRCHAPEGGTVKIRARQCVEHVQIEVSDTGTAMSAEVRPRCMDPFFSTKGDKGTGLGLAWSSALCNAIKAAPKSGASKGSATSNRFREKRPFCSRKNETKSDDFTSYVWRVYLFSSWELGHSSSCSGLIDNVQLIFYFPRKRSSSTIGMRMCLIARFGLMSPRRINLRSVISEIPPKY